MINLLLQLLYIQCVIFLFFFFYSLFQREKLGACLRIIEFFWCPGQKEERRNSNQILSVSNEIKNNSWTADCVHHLAKGSVFDDP